MLAFMDHSGSRSATFPVFRTSIKLPKWLHPKLGHPFGCRLRDFLVGVGQQEEKVGGNEPVFPISLANIQIISVTLFTPPSYSLSRPSVWVLSRSRSVVSVPRLLWTGVGSVTHGIRQARASSKMMEEFWRSCSQTSALLINSIYLTCAFDLWVLDQVSTDFSEICPR